jgi:hypothetical protein
MVYRGYIIGPRLRFIQVGVGRKRGRVFHGHEFTDADGYARVAETVQEAKDRIDMLEGVGSLLAAVREAQ